MADAGKSDPSKKDDAVTVEKAVTPSTVQPSQGGGQRLKLVGFVLGLIAVEAIAAYFILPSSTQANATVDKGAAAQQKQVAAKVAGVAAENTPDPTEGLGSPTGTNDIEVDLGEFSVTAFQPTTQTAMRIDFHLWGTLDQSQEQEFKAAWAKNTNRLRDQIIVIVRSAEISDLTDAGLGLIKRRILEKTNHTLGKPFLKSIVFSEFSFLEQ